MASVRCSKWPLRIVTLALGLMTAAAAHAQVQGPQSLGTQALGASDMELKAPPDATAVDPLNELKETITPEETSTPRPPPPGSKPVVRTKPGELPRLKPYPGAQRSGLRGGTGEPRPSSTAPPVEPTNTPGPTVAAAPTPPARRKIPADPNPFDPVGLRVGDIDVKPYVEQDAGYASNPLGSASAPKGSAVETTEIGAAWQSQWSRNDFRGQFKGGYTDYFETPEASGLYGSGTADGRFDASRDLTFDTEGRFTFLPQSLSNFGVTTTSGHNPYIETGTWGVTLGATQKFGDLSIGLHGAYDAQYYGDAPLGSGSASSLAADDYGDWSLKLKTAYRVSEAVSPYIEIDADARRYANGLDALDYRADSEGLNVLAGVTLSFSQMLNGELALGYGQRSYQDPRLPFAASPLVDASLIWAVTPLTTLTLKASTALNDAIISGASADINHSYSIDVSHALTRQLTLGLTGAYATDQFVGSSQTDQTWSVTAKAEYHVTRDLVFKLSVIHSAYSSNTAGQNSSNDTVMIGVKWQR